MKKVIAGWTTDSAIAAATILVFNGLTLNRNMWIGVVMYGIIRTVAVTREHLARKYASRKR